MDPITPSAGAVLLRTKAAGMRHAIVRSIAIYPDGHMCEETELHYLTCSRCELEKLAEEIEKIER